MAMHQRPYNPHGNIQPYIAPLVRKFCHYRTTDNSRVFFVLDINTVDHDTAHVVYVEWGKLEPTRKPLADWEKGIKDGLLTAFRPSVQDYLFIDHKKKVA